ncbi:MAG: YbaB/EbfC family nucleoid-associated protein [Bacilli bacterium]|nr:YbaB/EbfC family nucleoid-associated protein [Bacilli bacterium]
MNMQALMKQAQKIQKEMTESKKIIDEKVFTATSSFVTVEVYGNKKVKKITINSESIDKDEIEMLEDIIVVAFNEALKNIDEETEETMGKYTKGMPGLF